jgi:hypothetical protein
LRFIARWPALVSGKRGASSSTFICHWRSPRPTPPVALRGEDREEPRATEAGIAPSARSFLVGCRGGGPVPSQAIRHRCPGAEAA